MGITYVLLPVGSKNRQAQLLRFERRVNATSQLRRVLKLAGDPLSARFREPAKHQTLILARTKIWGNC